MSIQVEDGKAYRTRSTGEIVDIRGRVDRPGHYAIGRWIGHFRNGGHAYWHDDGAWMEPGEEWPADLVEEVAS